MGLLDKVKRMTGGLKDKTSELAEQHGEKVTKGVDKATDAIDKKTKGKHRSKLDKVDDAAEKAVGKLAGGGADDTGQDPSAPTT